MLKTSDNLDQRFRKYVYLCSQNPGFGSEAIINLERAKFIESLKNVFPKTNDCRGRLYINYKGEPGVDAGGLLRDFYDSLGLEGMNEKNKLFEQQNNYYRIHTKSNHKYLKVYGSALANAIIHKNKVPISFCDSLLRIMLKLPLNESSLEAQNPKLYENFKALRAYSSEELESLCLNFTVMVDKKSIPLCKDGKKLYLNHGNLEKYISLMVEWELKGYANKSIEKFIKGFFKVAEPLAGKFSVSELRHVMSGLDNDYIEILKEKIECPSNLEKERTWLIRWLGEKDEGIVKKFLKFCTGNSLIPVGKDDWKIRLTRTPHKGLPISHTCFKLMEMPPYTSYEELCEKMELAVTEGNEGFYMA